ncbi:protein lines [Cimex lectularius]|uniref:Protein lines n=1 Tax=Cimex lectularius TaxID=79782 RepID=A0A8I6RQ55_CIMLE|nr:protein lines [Cimex lectularius]
MVLTKEKSAPVAVMDEPVKKKSKLSEENNNNDLETLQKKLLGQCLCTMPENLIWKPFRGLKLLRHEDSHGYCASYIANWNRDRTLLFVSSVQLLCEVAIRQNTRGLVCSKIVDTCEALIRNEYGLVEYLIELSAHSDRYVSYVSGRALSAFLMVSRAHVDPRWLDRLTENALSTSHPQKMAFSLDVMKRVTEWKDCDEHPLEERDVQLPPLCHVLSVSDPDSLDSSQIKCLCIKALEAKWPAIVSRFDRLLATSPAQNDSTVITFLGLWEAIISVKANLSIVDTKPFYAHLANFVALLNSGVSPIVWKHMLDLFNEVLCYGSTLALQDILAEEPCSLAHLIVRSVKDWRLLEAIPFRGGSGRFGGGSGDGDKPLLQKAVLLVLKAVAVTVKETRCESSSDSSVCSESEDADADMAVIERSIREVLRQLDNCVKTLLPFHPETPLAQWVVQLFSDQDDALIEGMVCCLDVSVGLFHRENASQDLRRALSPAISLAQFLRTVSHGSDVLLDFLVSNETCFLLYLLRLLKYIRRNWHEFASTCGNELSDIMTVFTRLRLAIERLIARSLFPYNINPVLRLLEKCEQMYESMNV